MLTDPRAPRYQIREYVNDQPTARKVSPVFTIDERFDHVFTAKDREAVWMGHLLLSKHRHVAFVTLPSVSKRTLRLLTRV